MFSSHPTLSLATPTAEAASPQRKNLADTGAADFVPGTVLSERYRIVARLGRGGMGEIYRADDLRLGQTVALKFLPQAISRDPAALARVDHEVRIARQVAHPNVCRVFDVAESGRGPFITMEFIDGEDLASLLRRIGRLPADKGLQIAHQLCAGIAAAHELGVVHRDLKPSNVMLDGRGRVRITDFGLALVAHDLGEQDTYAGTPDYMAPEQLAGATVTFRSDIYALGLLLYEVFTGAYAFGATGSSARRRGQKTPVRPSSVVRGLDPAIERVILRCLEQDPQARPASAIEVSAALPGGDRLRAGIAAGETPAPETVAAAGAPVFVPTPMAFAMLALVLAAMAAAVILAGYGTSLGLAPADKSPDFLAERARSIIARFGYHEPLRDDASWFGGPTGRAGLYWDRNPIRGPDRFVYRLSSRPMVPKNYYGLVWEDDPPPVPGDFLVVLDTRGHLLEFVARPSLAAKASGVVNWNLMLDEAGMPPNRLSEKELDWVPPVPYDSRRSWQATDSNSGLAYNITAAWLNNQPAYFRVVPAGSKPVTVDVARSQWLSDVMFVTVACVLWCGGIYLARRNLRRGRGDRKGAQRVAGFILACGFLGWLFSAHHVSSGSAEYYMFIGGTGLAMYTACFAWVQYLAVEPYARQRWPEMLISWTRVLSGQVRDTRVGRDLLIGAIAGGMLAVLHLLVAALPRWTNNATITPLPTLSMALRGASAGAVSLITTEASVAIQWALAAIGFLLLAKVVMRNFRVALAFAVVAGAVIDLPAGNFPVAVTVGLLTSATLFFVLLRYGLVSVVAILFFLFVLQLAPLTFDFSRWYAGRSLFVLAVLASVAVFGFVAVLGGRPLFHAELDEP